MMKPDVMINYSPASQVPDLSIPGNSGTLDKRSPFVLGRLSVFETVYELYEAGNRPFKERVGIIFQQARDVATQIREHPVGFIANHIPEAGMAVLAGMTIYQAVRDQRLPVEEAMILLSVNCRMVLPELGRVNLTVDAIQAILEQAQRDLLQRKSNLQIEGLQIHPQGRRMKFQGHYEEEEYDAQVSFRAVDKKYHTTQEMGVARINGQWQIVGENVTSAQYDAFCNTHAIVEKMQAAYESGSLYVPIGLYGDDALAVLRQYKLVGNKQIKADVERIGTGTVNTFYHGILVPFTFLKSNPHIAASVHDAVGRKSAEIMSRPEIIDTSLFTARVAVDIARQEVIMLKSSRHLVLPRNLTGDVVRLERHLKETLRIDLKKKGLRDNMTLPQVREALGIPTLGLNVTLQPVNREERLVISLPSPEKADLLAGRPVTGGTRVETAEILQEVNKTVQREMLRIGAVAFVQNLVEKPEDIEQINLGDGKVRITGRLSRQKVQDALANPLVQRMEPEAGAEAFDNTAYLLPVAPTDTKDLRITASEQDSMTIEIQDDGSIQMRAADGMPHCEELVPLMQQVLGLNGPTAIVTDREERNEAAMALYAPRKRGHEAQTGDTAARGTSSSRNK